MLSFNEFSHFCVICTDFVISKLQDHQYGKTTWSFKQDGTRVTEVDFLIEDKLREQIISAYPNHGILGEERESINPDADFVWVLDPIDGTYSFSKGVPLFGNLIGLNYKGKPMYGFLRLPMINDTWISGDCKQTYINGQVLKTKAFSGMNDSLILTTDQQTLTNSPIYKHWQKAINLGATARTWGDCYGYYLLCLGEADLMVDTGLKPFDILPLIPILRGAGMRIEQLGDKEDYSEIMAGKKEIFDAII